MLILTASDVRKALPMDQAIEAMRQAFSALSSGRVKAPLRTRLPIAPHDAVSLFMPAYMQEEPQDALAVKIVSVYPHNPGRGLPLIHAAVLVLNAESGAPAALLEGGSLTAIRTGAASGLATELLARPDCVSAAIFGAGAQARTQLEAVCTVRRIHTVWIYDPNPERVQAFITEMAGVGPVPLDLRRAISPHQAVQEADVICTATTSSTPVFEDSHIRPGTHINGVGSYTPEMQEVPSGVVRRARLVVDAREAALVESGDLAIPISSGEIEPDVIYAELGEIASGEKPGRLDPTEITFFKSVGVAAQDVAAARLALANAQQARIGQLVDW